MKTRLWGAAHKTSAQLMIKSPVTLQKRHMQNNLISIPTKCINKNVTLMTIIN